MRPCQALRMRTPPTGGVVYPAGIRATRLTYVAPANSIAFVLPTGSQAGDLCTIFVCQGFNIIFPSGWMPISDLQVTNWKGYVAQKVLTSGDISTGTVTITFTGTPYRGDVFGLTTIGSLGIRSFVASNNNSGAPSRSLTTDAAPVAGDYIILFGSIDANGAVTSSSLATALESDSQAASAAAKYDVVGSSGAQSATVNYGGSPSGDYQALLVLTPTAVSTLYTNTGGTGNRSALITVSATSITAGGGAPGDTVDGTLTNSYWWTNATGNGTAWLTFDFGVGASKVIDQLRLYQDTAQSHGTWRFEGSNDNSTWTQCGVDFTLQAFYAIPVPNTTGYRYYRLRHMSGSRSQTPYIREFEFKIA